MSKPWEGREVWFSGNSKGNLKGWLEAKEISADYMEIVITTPDGFARAISGTRQETRVFAAHLMNLAKDRPLPDGGGQSDGL